MINTLAAMLSSYESGMTLPQSFYTDEGVFTAEKRDIFQAHWLFVGHSCEVTEPGEYFTVPIGDESLIIVRDQQGNLQAYFNVCRHRGSRLTTESKGCVRSLVCPYHGWAYDLEGRLKAARLMGEDFEKKDYPLHRAHVRELCGLVFVCLSSGDPPDFEDAIRAIAPQLLLHRLEQAKVVGRDSYLVNANWKTIIENNRECYHCQVAHPEFMSANYDAGLPGDRRNHDSRFEQKQAQSYRLWEAMGLNPRDVSFPNGAWFRVSRFSLKDGFITESLDGQLVAPLMGDLPNADVGSLRIVGLPNFWAHANADYAMTTRVIPINARQTQIEVTFLVEQNAVEGVDYELENVIAVWQATSEQDWKLCENNYAGVCSTVYQPGKLSPLMESSVISFLDWYIQKLQSKSVSLLEPLPNSLDRISYNSDPKESQSAMQPVALNRSVQIEALNSVS